MDNRLHEFEIEIECIRDNRNRKVALSYVYKDDGTRFYWCNGCDERAAGICEYCVGYITNLLFRNPDMDTKSIYVPPISD